MAHSAPIPADSTKQRPPAWRKLRGLLALIIAVPATFLISAGALIDLIVGRRDAKKAQLFPRMWGRLICRLSGASVIISGIEHLEFDTPCIFYGNHVSWFDIFAFQGYFPHDFRWIAKKELFRIPLFGSAMRRAGIVSIDRSRGRQAVKSLDAAAERIAGGTSVLIFPEGTRSRDGRLGPFKHGTSLLAIKAGVALVPVGFNNTDNLLPKGSWLPVPGTIHLRIGPPLDTTGLTTKDKQVLSQNMEQALLAQLEPKHHSVATPSAAYPDP